MAVARSIKLKKLKKYEKEYLSIKAAERAREDPVVRLERENKKLLGENMRLDTENDNLARQLVNSKIEMRKEIDKVEDEKEFYEKEHGGLQTLLEEALEFKKRLQEENEQLKALLKREVEKLDAELVTRNNVIQVRENQFTTNLQCDIRRSTKSSRRSSARSWSVPRKASLRRPPLSRVMRSTAMEKRKKSPEAQRREYESWSWNWRKPSWLWWKRSARIKI